ncbi:MAG TPA: hypothetical protein VHG34_02360 [Nitrososphaeraceae archaeon]|nr:hypothetical protein [Nitrososphaeraceae archaeon]
MTRKTSQCKSCTKIFDSKRELKDHIEKNHRITDEKILPPYWDDGR